MEYFRSIDESQARIVRFRREAADHRLAVVDRRRRRQARRRARLTER